MNKVSEPGRPSSGKKKLRDLLVLQDNRICADCSAPNPKWASANLGVFICLKCCGVHRTLGPNVSKVLSVSLDDWCEEDISRISKVGGNAAANSIYESYIPNNHTKPRPDASHDARTKFIRSKYEFQEFMKPSMRTTNCEKNDEQTSSKQEAKVEFIGILKVKVVKGTNLAVRDMLSSDPYVVVNLGEQSVQTSVMGSNLNPIWDEELQINVPMKFGVLKVQVFDYDTFSADDIMGEAEVDLQPLISSGMQYKNPTMYGNMQIGTLAKSSANALAHNSTINIIDGKLKQDMSLHLQNVESGQLDLQLEYSTT